MLHNHSTFTMAANCCSGRAGETSPTLQATSAIKKSAMSTTLPRNFAPLSWDPADPPKTPDQTFAPLELPPPPPHSTYRMRRPRLTLEGFDRNSAASSTTLFASEIPLPSSAGPLVATFPPADPSDCDHLIPSIERTCTPTRPALQSSYSEPLTHTRLRLSELSSGIPQTPSSQTMKTPIEIKREEWNMQRAASTSSRRSTSSSSSADTLETRPTSFDGSATSPDVEHDPFLPHAQLKITPATPLRKSKKQRLASFFTKHNVMWTIEMDNHLFNVYQIYLADPTVTPFKTVPGSIPPTGVCHRVSRRARETWPHATRISSPLFKRSRVRSLLDVNSIARERTPDVEHFLISSSQGDRPRWPSEAATRKRLKQLCREKFTISAHYNRLRESRSPSPFSEQFSIKRSTRASRSPSRCEDESSAFETRKMHIDLVSTGATAPLAQLTTGDSPALGALEAFNRDMDEAQIKHSSPPTGLGIQEDMVPAVVDRGKLAAAIDAPRLASPFAYNTWNAPLRPETRLRKHITQGHFDTIHVTGVRLQSPFRPDLELGANINKRRAQHNLEDELSPSGSSLAGHTLGLNLDEGSPMLVVKEEPVPELVFSGSGELGQRRIRVRNRGATLGSAHERIARMFAPPADEAAPPVPALPAQYAAGGNASLMPPKVDENQRQLGSPFELDPNRKSLRNKPRHLPSLSDPFISFTHGVPSTAHSGSNIGNIGERLANFEQTFGEQRQQ